MKNILKHVERYIVGGILAVVPLFLVYIVLQFIYKFIDQNVLNLIDNFTGIRFPGLGLLTTIIILYIIGVLSRNIIGKWFLNLVDKVANKIPIINTTYEVGKQISNTLSLPEKQVFKKVVLLKYLTEDMYTIGFITGRLKNNKTDETLLKIFVPTPPNPTSGTMVIAREEEIVDPGWTIDEGIKTVISAGIIGPDDIAFK